MPSNLLQDLLDLGETMKNCLQKGNVDTFFDLVEERGTLLDALQAYQHPSDIAANWEEMAEALSEQGAELMEAAEVQRRTMQEAITRIEQVKDAQRSYLDPGVRSNILNKNLRV